MEVVSRVNDIQISARKIEERIDRNEQIEEVEKKMIQVDYR